MQILPYGFTVSSSAYATVLSETTAVPGTSLTLNSDVCASGSSVAHMLMKKVQTGKTEKVPECLSKKNKKTCTNFLWLIIIPQVLFPDNHTSSSFSGQTMNIHYPRKLHLTPSNPHVQRNHKHIHRPHTILISHSVSWLLVHYDSVHINYIVILLRLHYMHYDATPHKHL